MTTNKNGTRKGLDNAKESSTETTSTSKKIVQDEFRNENMGGQPTMNAAADQTKTTGEKSKAATGKTGDTKKGSV